MTKKERKKTEGAIGTTEEETEKLRSGELDSVIVEKPSGLKYEIEDTSE